MIKKTVRKQVLLPLTFTFVILIFTFIGTSYHLRSIELIKSTQNQYQRVQSIFASLISGRTKYMNSIADFIAEQQNFQSAMQTGDRRLLLSHGEALFERISEQMDITHFYFHDKNGEMLLRVYQPENLSTASHKYIMQKTVETKKTVSGLELGKNGTFTLRLVSPWFINGELSGYIEIGQEVYNILNELKSIAEIDFIVMLNKKYLKRDAWENGMKIMGHEPNWNQLMDKVIVEKSLDLNNMTEVAIINQCIDNETCGEVLKVDKTVYRLSLFPLVDVVDRAICQVILLGDITDATLAFKAYVIKVTCFSMLLCSALFAFAYRVLGKVDIELKNTGERLLEELEIQEATAADLAREVDERCKAENELKILNENLEQIVHDRTAELYAANTELEEGRIALERAYRDLKTQHITILQQDKMACIGQLAASVAHDINNPVGFVVGNMDVLVKYWNRTLAFVDACDDMVRRSGSTKIVAELDDIKKQLKIAHLSGEIPAIMSECREGLERIKRIVLNLKGFSSVDDEDASYADIHECIESTIGIVLHEIRHKADIIRDYGDVPKLLCNPQQISQVFMNLLINSSQAIEEWGKIKIITRSDGQRYFYIYRGLR